MNRVLVLRDALLLGIGQLSDLRVIRVFVTVLAVVAVVTAPFALVVVGVAWVIEVLTPAHLSLPWLGEVRFLGLLTAGLGSRASWMFWTYVVAPLVLVAVGMFLDGIVDAVERRHYAGLPQPQRRKPGEVIIYAIRFLGLTASVSLGALIVSLFSGVLAPVVMVAANGYLIAREYFETVAMRRIGQRDARRLGRAHPALLWVLGALVAVGMTLPYVNLLVPVVGIAAFTHIFHSLHESR